MKSFNEFRRTATRLHETLVIGKTLNFIKLMANESETKTFPAERSMPSDLEDPGLKEDEIDEDEVLEDAPVNNAGGGAIAGIGVGPQGEPGVPVTFQRRKKRTALIVGPPPSDPRMFQAKIFARRPPNFNV